MHLTPAAEILSEHSQYLTPRPCPEPPVAVLSLKRNGTDMASPEQTEANRRNAQRSTGPRTAAGKSASRMNALKSGMHARSLIIFDESYSDLDDLMQEYFDRFQPATPEERALVDTLVNADWLLRRLRRIEPELWQTTYANYMEYGTKFRDVNTPLAYIYGAISKEFDRVQVRINSFDRAYHRALMDLTRLQKERKAAEPQPEAPAPSLESQAPNPESTAPNPKSRTPNPESVAPNPESRTPNPAIGFVPKNRRPAANQAKARGPKLRSLTPEPQSPAPALWRPAPDSPPPPAPPAESPSRNPRAYA
jgi:hypothetical protein